MDQASLQSMLNRMVQEDPLNRLDDGTLIFVEPLLGFAAAGDPLFGAMQQEGIVGELFQPPEQWLPEAVTVISYFLPFSDGVRRSNYPTGELSPQWLHGRFRGEKFNDRLRQAVAGWLEAAGSRAVVPMLVKGYAVDYTRFASSWSERHVAYIAGLGTFSLNRGLITRQGMAGRFGSVITDREFPVTEREYNSPFEYCLYLRDGSCGVCMGRCPQGAITEKGKDNAGCQYYMQKVNPLAELCTAYGYPYSACGKCQTGVPCEMGIPGR